MRKLGKILDTVLAAANMVVALLMFLSAFSWRLSPAEWPYLSSLGLVYMVFFGVNAVFLVVWLLRHSWWALLPVFAAALTWGAFRLSFPINIKNSGKADGDIAVLSYNVMAFDMMHQKDVDENDIMTYIVESGADIVCLQEYLIDSNAESKFEKRMKDYAYHRTADFKDQRFTNRVACFSKYPIIGVKKIDAETRANNGAAVFFLNVDGDSVAVFNCHLESNHLTSEDKELYKRILNNPEAEMSKKNVSSLLGKFSSGAAVREHQAGKVREEMDKYVGRIPVLVCGDFNDGPLSMAHHVISQGMTDAFVDAGSGLGVSYNQDYFYFRIDNILVNSFWTVKSCKVDKSVRSSDHYPIRAILSRRQSVRK